MDGTNEDTGAEDPVASPSALQALAEATASFQHDARKVDADNLSLEV